ncbi:MAG TPA: hypothetical protein VJ553_00655 [Candidatus Paceibacterota bacterium]|nr:hypothetical protein [Candidatus Paceibacterota bacterium]
MSINIFVPILVAGLLGGVIRGVVGFIKHQFSYKNVPFDPSYFAGMMAMSGLVGLVTAVAVEDTGTRFLGVETLSPGMALIAGYAGGDFIENLYKIVFKKTPFGGSK